MSLQQLYETVIREEEYIMDKRRDMRGEFRSEFMNSGQEYCLYCLDIKGDRRHCCGENHFGTFAELPKDDQETLLDQEVDQYDEWSRK
jgi:hypothetical protein